MGKRLLILENVLFYLVLFLFVFIPLYPKFPLLNIQGTFVAIRLEDLIIGLTVSLWGIYLVLSNQLRVFLRDKLNQAILVFFFIGAVSSFSAVFLTHTVSFNLTIFHFLRRVEFMMLLPVVVSVIKSKKKFNWILVFLFLTVLAVNLYALGQQYLDWPVISTTNSEFSKGLILRLTPDARVNSTFAGHYDLAVFLAMVLTCVTALFFAFKNYAIKFWILILGLFSLLVLIMTAARISFVAAFVGIAAALLFSKKKKYILVIAIVALALLIYPSQLRDRLVSTVTVNLFHQGQRYEGKTEDQQIRSKLNIPTLAVKTSSTSAQTSTFATSSGIATDITPGEPIDTTQLGVYRSFQIRLNIEWPRAIAAFTKNPLLGSGYSSIDIATDNDILRSLGEVGILGTLAFILILTEIAKRIFQSLKNENKLIKFFSAGVLSMLIAFLVNGLFIDVFEASKVASLFWMILGLALAASRFEKYVKSF
ncbi:MAG: Uncharacterized protein G01um10147_437 [Microgenomates group bacterium Gr01-1014_7]|nr:MAG: Uncharacterized protein G01um10147_437 [Microgenomates group bacterium Gr01-1014_7]